MQDSLKEKDFQNSYSLASEIVPFLTAIHLITPSNTFIRSQIPSPSRIFPRQKSLIYKLKIFDGIPFQIPPRQKSFPVKNLIFFEDYY
jgi:hypothetical protein